MGNGNYQKFQLPKQRNNFVEKGEVKDIIKSLKTIASDEQIGEIITGIGLFANNNGITSSVLPKGICKTAVNAQTKEVNIENFYPIKLTDIPDGIAIRIKFSGMNADTVDTTAANTYPSNYKAAINVKNAPKLNVNGLGGVPITVQGIYAGYGFAKIGENLIIRFYKEKKILYSNDYNISKSPDIVNWFENPELTVKDTEISSAAKVVAIEEVQNKYEVEDYRWDIENSETCVEYNNNTILYKRYTNGIIEQKIIKDLINTENEFLRNHPVKTLYLSIESTNPGTLYGGTWVEVGKGRMLMGCEDGMSAESTGGNNTIDYTPTGKNGDTTLTINQMPSHDHSASCTDAGNHSHTAQSAGSHTHSVSGSTGGAGEYVFKLFSYPVSIDDIRISAWAFNSQNSYVVGRYDYTIPSHTHSFSGTSSSDGAHTHSTNSTGSHSHTITVNSKGGDESHNHSFSGTKATLNIKNPYYAVYVWKRIA